MDIAMWFLGLFSIVFLIFLFKNSDKGTPRGGNSSCGVGCSGIKIYRGYGYDVAYRIDGDKIYSGGYGYDVAYRIDGDKVYSGSYGYDVAYRIDGDKVYSGGYGYDVAYRIDGSKIYSGSYGYDTAYRIDS